METCMLQVVCADILAGSWQKLSPSVLVVSMVGLNAPRTSYVNESPGPSDLETCAWVHSSRYRDILVSSLFYLSVYIAS